MRDFQATDAAPDYRFAAVIVPVDSPVKLTAFAADNDLCEAVIAGVGTFPAGWAFMYYPAADKLFLYLHEQLFRNNCFVVILDIVLRNRAVVLDALLRQEVRGVALLQQCVAHVLLVSKNLVDGAGVPHHFACAGENAICHKAFGDFIHAGAFEVFPVDAFYDFCLLRVDDEVTVFVFGVA